MLWKIEVFTALTMKNGDFWDVTPCGSCKNLSFRGAYRLHHQGDKNRYAYLHSLLLLLVTANGVPSLPILVTLMMEATRYSETSVLTRVTPRNIPEDGNLYSHRRGNLKSYIALTGWSR
jgi:hypothetical protein